jgi:hypothetical protein
VDKNKSLIELSERGRFWALPFEDLSRSEQVFRLVWELEGQVNNGGFEQYFFNQSGDFAHAVVAALQEIGAPRTANVVSRAVAVFPVGRPPEDEVARRALLEVLPEEALDLLSRPDEEFYRYEEDLTGLLFEYVRVNAGAIEGSGDPGDSM